MKKYVTKVDTRDMSIEIKTSITWKSVQVQLDYMRYEVQKWYDAISHKEGFVKEELEAAKRFLDVGELSAEQKIRVLELIQDEINKDCFGDKYEFQWIRDGIKNWVEDDFNFPCYNLNR